MIWFVVAAVLIVAGAVMIRLSRAGVAPPPLPLPRQEQRENLFEPGPKRSATPNHRHD